MVARRNNNKSRQGANNKLVLLQQQQQQQQQCTIYSLGLRMIAPPQTLQTQTRKGEERNVDRCCCAAAKVEFFFVYRNCCCCRCWNASVKCLDRLVSLPTRRPIGLLLGLSLSFIVYFSPFYVMLSAQRWHVSMTTAAVAASMNPTTTHRPFSPPHTRKRFTSKSFVALKNIFL